MNDIGERVPYLRPRAMFLTAKARMELATWPPVIACRCGARTLVTLDGVRFCPFPSRHTEVKRWRS
jgi:hypothetical protein